MTNNPQPSVFKEHTILTAGDISHLAAQWAIQPKQFTRQGDFHYLVKIINWCNEYRTAPVLFNCCQISEEISKIDIEFQSDNDAMLFKLTF